MRAPACKLVDGQKFNKPSLNHEQQTEFDKLLFMLEMGSLGFLSASLYAGGVTKNSL
jgi:hypothetical protein